MMPSLWPFKLLFGILITRAGRRVMLGRMLDPEQPEKGRWLKADVEALIKDVRKRADDLLVTARLEELNRLGNRLMVLLATYTIAAYQILLERGIPANHAMDLTADLGWDIYAKMTGFAALPHWLTTSDPHKRMERTIRAMTIFPFSAPGAPGYDLKMWSEDGKLFTHWLHCPPQTFVRRLVEEQGDHGELEAFYRSWCLYDWPGADVIAGDGRCGHYDRQKTLSKGDSVCDMCWHGRPLAGGEKSQR